MAAGTASKPLPQQAFFVSPQPHTHEQQLCKQSIDPKFNVDFPPLNSSIGPSSFVAAVKGNSSSPDVAIPPCPVAAIDPASIPLQPLTVHQGKPAFFFPLSHHALRVEQLKWTLVGKFSHGRPLWNHIKQFFLDLKLTGSYKISVFDFKHIFIVCSCKADFDRLWLNLTWSINGVPMRVFKWGPEFNPVKESSIQPVWIRMTGLPLHLLDELSIIQISHIVGVPIIVDPRNINQTMLNQARVCVQLNVNKPLLESCWIGFKNDSGEIVESHFVKVSYDFVPAYCSSCDHVGHKIEDCKRLVAEHDTEVVIQRAGKEHSSTEVRKDQMVQPLSNQNVASSSGQAVLHKEPLTKSVQKGSSNKQEWQLVVSKKNKTARHSASKVLDADKGSHSHQFVQNITQEIQSVIVSCNKDEHKETGTEFVDNDAPLTEQQHLLLPAAATDLNVALASGQTEGSAAAVVESKSSIGNELVWAGLSNLPAGKALPTPTWADEVEASDQSYDSNIQVVAHQKLQQQQVCKAPQLAITPASMEHSKQSGADQHLSEHNASFKNAQMADGDISRVKFVPMNDINAEQAASIVAVPVAFCKHPYVAVTVEEEQTHTSMQGLVIQEEMQECCTPDLKREEIPDPTTQEWQEVGKKNKNARGDVTKSQGVITRSQMKASHDTWANIVEEEHNTQPKTKAQASNTAKQSKKQLERKMCKLGSRLNNIGDTHKMRRQLQEEMDALQEEYALLR